MDLSACSLKELDLELLNRRDLAESCWLDFCEAAYHAIERQAYAAAGYEDPVRYFEERVHVSYRGLRRSLTIFEGLKALPAADQEEAKDALVRIGKHKAATLVPILQRHHVLPGSDGEPPAPDWREWARRAERLTEKALQAEVTEYLGHGRTPSAEEQPGERFFKTLRIFIPDDAWPEVERAFELGKRVAKSENAVNVFLSMVREVIVEWEHRAEEKYR